MKKSEVTVNIVQKSKIFRKTQEIADDHYFGTEYARNVKFELKCAVLDTLLDTTTNSISTKMDLSPVGNELFKYNHCPSPLDTLEK